MTSDKVDVSINLNPELGNDEYIIVCNFSGRGMSGFEVIEASEGPSGRRKQKNRSEKNPGNLQYRDLPSTSSPGLFP